MSRWVLWCWWHLRLRGDTGRVRSSVCLLQQRVRGAGEVQVVRRLGTACAILFTVSCGGETAQGGSPAGGAGGAIGGSSGVGGSSDATVGGGAGALNDGSTAQDALSDSQNGDAADSADGGDCAPKHGVIILGSCCAGKPCYGTCKAGECECYGLAGGCTGGLVCCLPKLGCTMEPLCDISK